MNDKSEETLEYVTKRFHRLWTSSAISEPKNQTLKELIAKLMKLNLTYIENWLQEQFKYKEYKNVTKSRTYRQEGNSFYCKKNVEKSLEFYTRSLCYAPSSSEEFGLALANRSAVLFEMEKYDDCIKDIDLCLSSNFPQHLKLKILIRKMESLLRLKRLDEFDDLLHSEQVKILNEANDKYLEKIEYLKSIKSNEIVSKIKSDTESDILSLENIQRNDDFAYASSQIGIRYNLEKGRHVVAKEDIKSGSMLFIEKAFVFSLIFNPETGNFPTNKCYFCLKNILNGIPCSFCVKCIFCDEQCKIKSWKESHEWECPGMETDIWYDLGIALPAFKILIKGINSGFIDESSEISIKQSCSFGNILNNYPYVNSLVYHHQEHSIETLVCAATVWKYLLKYTKFFPFLQKEPSFEEKRLQDLEFHVVYFLAKHILQLQNNSSIIEHWDETKNNELPSEKKALACGLFPSVSIMNHSCKPNITNYFIDDTIIVKALEDIKSGDEIYNCYGIDYRHLCKEERQNYCLKLYNFKCGCVICADPSKEMEYFDSLICNKCGEKNLENTQMCSRCLSKFDMDELIQISNKTKKELQGGDDNELLRCLQNMTKIFNIQHREIQDVYLRLYEIYLERGDMENMVKYVEIWINNEQLRVGKNSLIFGRLLYQTARKIKLVNGEDENGIMSKKANRMLQQARTILRLYFPETNLFSLKF